MCCGDVVRRLSVMPKAVFWTTQPCVMLEADRFGIYTAVSLAFALDNLVRSVFVTVQGQTQRWISTTPFWYR